MPDPMKMTTRKVTFELVISVPESEAGLNRQSIRREIISCLNDGLFYYSSNLKVAGLTFKKMERI